MKYRIRKIPSRSPKGLRRGVRLRFAGSNGLSRIKRLPEPIEGVSFSDDDLKGLKRRRTPRLRIEKLLKGFFVGLYSELRALYGKAARLVRRSSKWLSAAVWKRIEARTAKRIDSLPMLFGALTSCALVCATTLSIVLIALFAPYARSYDTVTIPSFQGMMLSDIGESEERLNMIIRYENNPEIADGQVISQLPAAGVTRKLYGRDDFCDIVLTVSRREVSTVPEGLEGMTRRDATLALLNLGIAYTVTEEYSESVRSGSVISAYPRGGSVLGNNDRVELTVSLGMRQQLSTVPDLTGLSEGEATRRIEISELSLGDVTYVRSEKAIGTVVSQSLKAHSSAPRDSAISLSISAGEAFEARVIPDLYGMSIDDATAALHKLGITVSSVYSVSSESPSGTVIWQDPLPLTPITSAITSVKLRISE